MRFRFKYVCSGNLVLIGCIDKFLSLVFYLVWWKIFIMFLIFELSCILWWWEGGGGDKIIGYEVFELYDFV